MIMLNSISVRIKVSKDRGRFSMRIIKPFNIQLVKNLFHIKRCSTHQNMFAFERLSNEVCMLDTTSKNGVRTDSSPGPTPRAHGIVLQVPLTGQPTTTIC